MDRLPIDAHLPSIIDTLRVSPALVLVAEPGAGKTTLIPPSILNANLLPKEHPAIVMLQPRRVAARTSAMRIADENAWLLGREVGYHVRFDRKLTRDTRIRILTEGILTRQLVDDPFLDGIGCVILDEFHERSLNTDVAIALLREIQQTVRPDLKLVVMSATIDAEPVAGYLGDCPIVRVPGRTYPVSIRYRERRETHIEDDVRTAVADVLGGKLNESRSDSSPASRAGGGGDILIFLPGADEIRRTMEAVAPLARAHNMDVLPLHGTLSSGEQLRAVLPSERRRIICATNIAETSLTIPGVRTVIDSGLARMATYDNEPGVDRLELVRISKASATQRAGRAGRLGEGACIRLWNEKLHHSMPEFETPEVLRVDLTGTLLALFAWGREDPHAFNWFARPREDAMDRAVRLLEMLGAVTSSTDAGSRGSQITMTGREMLKFPLHARLARLLVSAPPRFRHDAVTIAAILSEKDFLRPEGVPLRHRQPVRRSSSDVLERVRLLEEFERERGRVDETIDIQIARQVVRVRDDLERIMSAGKSGEKRLPPILGTAAEEKERLKWILLAYPDRVCVRRSRDTSAGACVGGAGVRLSPDSCVVDGELFVAVDARADARSRQSESLVRIASKIEREWLAELFPQSISRTVVATFDETRRKVVGEHVTMYRDLVIQSEPGAIVDSSEAGRVLYTALLPKLDQLLDAEAEAATLLARIAFLRHHAPELNFAEISRDDALRAACENKRDMREIDLTSAIRSKLVYPLDRKLDELAPTTVLVPTGNRVKLKYEPGGEVVLAVRIQELFGQKETPRIAGGRVPVTIHLLGPNYRPVQITKDLRSFWATTYFQVRKDLRAQYPKHSWPEDPLTAPPQAKGSRRR
jgi:ATP-dependent helicase HrpB